MSQVRFKSLADTMKLLGCFKVLRTELPPVQRGKFLPVSCLNQMPLPRLSRNGDDYMKMVVLKCFTSMASSCFENWDIDDSEFQSRASISSKTSRIIHPGAIGAVIELLPSLWVDEEINGEEFGREEFDVERNRPLQKVVSLIFNFHQF